MIVFCQFYSQMLAIGWSAFANIYCYIEDSTLYTAHQFALGIWWTLEVQASHHAIAAHRLVVLAEVNTVSQDSGNLLIKLSLAEALEEVATSVAEEAWLYNEYAFYFCFIISILFFRKSLNTTYPLFAYQTILRIILHTIYYSIILIQGMG